MKIRTVLVTGEAGFISSYLAEHLLSEGYSIVILDNESTDQKRNVPSDPEYIRGDVINPQDIQRAFKFGIDAVFHIAG